MTTQDTYERIRDQVRASGLLGESGPVVAMVSGGQDSVCLLDVAVAVRGTDAVRALHVNYGLREASDEDARHVQRLCERLSVELRLVPVQERERLRARGNLQAWARELRYGAALWWAEELDSGSAGTEHSEIGDVGAVGNSAGARVATGHTSSDQVETILYRLAASPGRRALLGMAPREGRIVRPLLTITREQTAAYCRARGLTWREDASNDDTLYARARVRRSVVPALRSVHPAAERSVLRTAELLRAEAEVLDALVEAQLDGVDGAGVGGQGRGGDGVRGRGRGGEGVGAIEGGGEGGVEGGVHGRGGEPSITIARLSELHPALARLVVIRLAEDAAGAYVPQAGMRLGEILALGMRGATGEVHVGGNVAARVQEGVLRMAVLPPRPNRT